MPRKLEVRVIKLQDNPALYAGDDYEYVEDILKAWHYPTDSDMLYQDFVQLVDTFPNATVMKLNLSYSLKEDKEWMSEYKNDIYE